MGKPYEIEIYVLRDSLNRGISREILVPEEFAKKGVINV